MPLPSNVTTTTVTGTYVYDDGTAASGTVTFTPTQNQWLTDAGGPAILLPKTISVTLDASGHFSVSLPSTNDVNLSPSSWTWDVVETFGTLTRKYSIAVAGATMDLAAVAPVTPAGGGGQAIVTSVNGKGPNTAGAVTLVASDISGIVATTRQVATGTGLSGGGDLSADRTLAVVFGTGAGQVAQGNDSRITGSLQSLAAADGTVVVGGAPTAPTVRVGTIAESQVTNLTTDLGARVLTSQIGQASGVAGLDGTGKVPSSQVPDLSAVYLAVSRLGANSGAASLDSSGRVPSAQAYNPFVPITNRTHFNGNGGAAASALPATWLRYARTPRRVIRGGATQLQLEWANIFTNNTTGATEVNGPNSVAIRMSVEYPAGNYRQVSGSTAWSNTTVYNPLDQVTYNGNAYVAVATTTAGTTPTSALGTQWQQVSQYLVRWDGDDGAGTLTVAPGQIVASQKITLPAPLVQGAVMAINMSANTGSATGQFPYGCQATTTGNLLDWMQDWTASPPVPNSGSDPVTNWVTTASNAATSSSYLPMPSVVTGNAPDTRTTLILGDSIAMGTGDNYVDGTQPGWIVRALGTAPYWRAAQGGQQMGSYSTVGATPWQMAAAARCSAVICQLGVNDLQQGQSSATIQARAQAVWGELARRGARVWQTTLGPFTNSSDNWATLGNESAWTTGGAGQFGASSQWMTYNAWLMDGAPITVEGVTVRAGDVRHPLAGIIAPPRAIIDPATGWKWIVTGSANGYTIDGAHPNAAGHALIANRAAPTMASVAGQSLDRSPASGLTYPVVAHDFALYGDVLSTTERRHVGSTYTNLNGNLVLTAGVATRTVQVSQITYGFINGAGTSTTQTMALYVGADPASMAQVATIPVTQSQLTAAGPYIYTVALSQAVAIQAGARWAIVLQVSGYTTQPGWMCAPGAAGSTAVNFYSTLVSPDAGRIYAAAKAGSSLPSTLNSADGSWSAIAQQPWAALS